MPYKDIRHSTRSYRVVRSGKKIVKSLRSGTVSYRNIWNSTLSHIVLRDGKGLYRVIRSGTE